MSKRKISLTGEDSTVISVRVPRSWVDALKAMETEEIKQGGLVRRAIRRFIREQRQRVLKKDVPF